MHIKVYFFLSYILIWIGLTGLSNIQFTNISLILGIAFFVLILAQKIFILPKKNRFNFNAFFYFFWLLKEIILSSIAVIKIVWRKDLKILPSTEVIKSVQLTEIGLVVYANSITLTPGTVTLSAQDNILLVHALDVEFMSELHGGHMDRKVTRIIK